MNDYVLCGGSTVDLTCEYLKERNIEWIGFHFSIDDKEFVDDMGVNLSSADFYQAMRDGGELTILLIVQHRKHQQTGISLVVARQVDLIRIDSKVLTQNRLRRDLADHRQKIEAALEILLIAKH